MGNIYNIKMKRNDIPSPTIVKIENIKKINKQLLKHKIAYRLSFCFFDCHIIGIKINVRITDSAIENSVNSLYIGMTLENKAFKSL